MNMEPLIGRVGCENEQVCPLQIGEKKFYFFSYPEQGFRLCQRQPRNVPRGNHHCFLGTLFFDNRMAENPTAFQVMVVQSPEGAE